MKVRVKYFDETKCRVCEKHAKEEVNAMFDKFQLHPQQITIKRLE